MKLEIAGKKEEEEVCVLSLKAENDAVYLCSTKPKGSFQRVARITSKGEIYFISNSHFRSIP